MQLSQGKVGLAAHRVLYCNVRQQAQRKKEGTEDLDSATTITIVALPDFKLMSVMVEDLVRSNNHCNCWRLHVAYFPFPGPIKDSSHSTHPGGAPDVAECHTCR